MGGGGLLAGVLQGLEEVGWGGVVPVLAAETQGADCLAASLDAGEVVTLPGITSVAKSLAGGVLNTVSEGHVLFISSRSRVYRLKNHVPVGLWASRSVRFSKWRVLIRRTGFGTVSSISDPTLSLSTCTRWLLEFPLIPPRTA